MNIRIYVMYLIRYFIYSGSAVLIDICLYGGLVLMGIFQPFTANIVSTTAGAFLAWFVSGRYLFRQHAIPLFKLVLWTGYICISIFIYSACVSLFISFGVHFMLSKALVLCLSFFINSCVFKGFILP